MVYKTLFLLFLSLHIWSCSDVVKSKQNSTDDKKMLLEIIDNFNSAFKEGDANKLASMIAESYLHTNSNSKPIDKKTWVDFIKKREEEIKKGDLIVHSYEMNETEVQLYEKTAIITAKIIVSSTRNGERKENEYRVTNIWIKENGTWKRSGFHDAKIK